jgi:NAD(P)-dependent dehydrogenase (short-subunit alcohol dehydrogenase family)
VATALPDADVMCVRYDVSIEADVAAAVEVVIGRHGRIDILVNNAGTHPTVTALDESLETDWDRMLDVRAKGCFLCSKHVMKHMRRQARGTIVNIASLAGPSAASQLHCRQACNGQTD